MAVNGAALSAAGHSLASARRPCTVLVQQLAGRVVARAAKVATQAKAPAGDAANGPALPRVGPSGREAVKPVRLLENVDYAALYAGAAGRCIPEPALWARLSPLLWYLPSDEQREQVRRALAAAAAAHGGQKRKSGEDFITHPLEVARILAEMRMDHESLIAALLHDTVEDTDAITFEDIEASFGAAVRRIVEGETKISKIARCTSDSDEKARDLQGLFLAMTEDVRIILVKLADRLHNMRTLYGMKREKQIKIGLETLQVFAPLAKLLGVYCVKEELEELSLAYTEPELYMHIKRWQDKQAREQQRSIEAAKADLEALLHSDSYLQGHARSFSVRLRPRPVYCVYKQLMAAARAAEAAKQGRASSSNGSSGSRDSLSSVDALHSLDGLPSSSNGRHSTSSSSSSGGKSSSVSGDAAARAAAHRRQSLLLAHLKDVPQRGVVLQVVMEEHEGPLAGPSYVMESQQLCYYVLGLVHSIWSPIPGALKDFIGSPKTNGYQSLHTTVVPLSILSKSCPLVPMEVQIRTANMDRRAELGVAASNWVGAGPLKAAPGTAQRLAPVMSAAVAAASKDCCAGSSSNGVPLGSSNGAPLGSSNGAGAASSSIGVAGSGNGVASRAGLSYGTSSSSNNGSNGNSSSGISSSGSSSSNGNGSSGSRSGQVDSATPVQPHPMVGNGVHGVEVQLAQPKPANGSNGSGAAKGRSFWMGLAAFMLESLAAGTSSVAAITGAAAVGVSGNGIGKSAANGNGSGYGSDGAAGALSNDQAPEHHGAMTDSNNATIASGSDSFDSERAGGSTSSENGDDSLFSVYGSANGITYSLSGLEGSASARSSSPASSSNGSSGGAASNGSNGRAASFWNSAGGSANTPRNSAEPNNSNTEGMHDKSYIPTGNSAHDAPLQNPGNNGTLTATALSIGTGTPCDIGQSALPQNKGTGVGPDGSSAGTVSYATSTDSKSNNGSVAAIASSCNGNGSRSDRYSHATASHAQAAASASAMGIVSDSTTSSSNGKSHATATAAGTSPPSITASSSYGSSSSSNGQAPAVPSVTAPGTPAPSMPSSSNGSSANSHATATASAIAAATASGTPPPSIAFMPRYSFQSSDGNWLTQMRRWNDDFVGSLSAREFVDGVTAEVLGQSVFVYTHTGELRRLPKGSTVVDFAYSVHTELGNQMTVALVNGRFVPPSYVLSNGEVVQVKRDPRVTAAAVRRHEQWVGLVATKSARLKLRAFVKEHAALLAPRTGGQSEGGSGVDGTDDAAGAAAAVLVVSCEDRKGMMAAVCAAIASCDINIMAAAATAADDGLYRLQFEVSGQRDDLQELLPALSCLPGVYNATFV